MLSNENLNSEEIIRELCACNGLSFEKIRQDGPATTTLEMFFSGYPKMAGLSYFPNLTQLILVGQNIHCIAGLESCHFLKELWITECHLSKIQGLHHCADLQKLYLYHNEISVIEGLENLLKLEVLWLNNNQINVIEGLDMMQNLKELNLANNLIHSIGESLDPNVQLERLNLSGNKISSFKELTNLARLPSLMDLGLKDPQYSPNPVCLLCNYAIHVLYHIPQLQRLDTYDVSEKQIKNLAESTVVKKIMYYNMRMKNNQRQQREELEKVRERTSKAKQVPENRIRALSFLVKNLEHELTDMQSSGNMQANIPISNKFHENNCDTEESNSQQSSERRKNNSDRLEQIHKKICALKERMIFWTRKLSEVEKHHEEKCRRMKDSFHLLDQFLQTELETVGNVRFEEGTAADSWFKSCYDLIVSRFCAMNFRAYGISGIKIHRIVRVHNRILRLKFEDKVQYWMDNEDLYTTESYKKKLEYLFYIFDPKLPIDKKELLHVLENGCNITRSSQLPEQEQVEAVLLTNSMSLCEGPRLEFLQKQAMNKSCDPEAFKDGIIVIAKVFLGRSVKARDDLPIKPNNYAKVNSVYRLQKFANSTFNSLNDEICSSKEHGNCDCSLRQCEWLVFDHEFILPEYVVEFEYISMEKSSGFVTPSNENAEDVSHDLKLDEDAIALEPFLKPKPKIISLDEKTVLSVARANIYSQITVLNLHGNSLSKLKDISRLNGLRKLIISFNEFSSLEDVSYLTNLEYLDASHNQVITLEGFKGLGKLKYLDLSWNKLTNSREDLHILRKHAIQLSSLDIRYNFWQKPASVLKDTIAILPSLTHLNGVTITEDEISEALQISSGSRITQASLLINARTDTVKPRCLNLLPSAQILAQFSKNCLDPNAELSNSWYTKITSLTLDSQNLVRITNLEKLVNLRWASFSSNHLTKIEGLEHCVNLEELNLDDNSISKLEGLSKLTKLRRLSINNNLLAGFDRHVIESLSHLHFLSAENNNISSLAGLQRGYKLIELYLSNNCISSNQEIYSLKGLNNLVILDMWGNPILLKHENYRLFVIFHLSAIKALDGVAVEPSECENAKDMFGGRLTSDMIAERIGHQRFTELQDLNWRTSSIRSIDLVPADHFRNVQTVNLENNNLTSFSGLIFLPNIKNLYLNHNRIESILPQQKSQSHLTNRQILHQKVSSSGYGQQGTSKGSRDTVYGEALSPVMQSLEVLHLGYNGINSLPMLQLGRLRNLKSLYLQGNEISHVEGLENLQFLRELVLDHNRIKAIAETSFAKLNSLVSLNLEENRLRDLNNLPPLLKLRKLLIGSNKIQEISEIEKLEVIPALVELSISGNPISRKPFLRNLLVVRLQNLQILDGILITAEDRARAEMYFMEQQSLTVPNAVMDLGNPVSTMIVSKPLPLRVTNFPLAGGAHHSLGADLHFNNGHEDIFQNEANKYKKLKNYTVGVGHNPQNTQDIALRQLRGGTHFPASYLTQQSGQARSQQKHPFNQENEGRMQRNLSD
ncbi:leucine-rich repeat-containing protein 9 isoform X3 [Xenopus tropicalis]|uniref:Leucine-rich repeat-containing protein 9 n=1 Tax=Xenopus tropicalis TaxID=8364 RepID=F6WHA5_XENTR|nr:leucine-rich repeat-containing protein 9 isoform X3 [Xenopus tropicalis]